MKATIEQYAAWRAQTPVLAGSEGLHAICHAPFASILFDTKGYVRSCCQSMTHSLGNITTQSLREIWDGAVNRSMRQKMMANELPSGCVTCRWDIEHGNFEQTFARLFDGFPVSEPEPAWPLNMWFLCSNACNLECVQCYGELSSSIRKHRDGLPALPRVYHDAFFEELRDFLPHLQLATFLGGEAFLSRENFRIWDMMIEDGLAPPTYVVTNGTIFNHKVERILSSLPCSISVSLDGATKETMESIRRNADYETVLANVRRFKEYGEVELSFCIMPQNHHEFADFLLLAEELGCKASANTVFHPPQFSICYLPTAELAAIVEAWQARDAEMTRRLERHGKLWQQELARLRQWLAHPVGAPSPVYLAGISAQMGVAQTAPVPFVSIEPRRRPPAADGGVPSGGGASGGGAGVQGARAELGRWAGEGQIDEATLDPDDLVHCSGATFGGLDGPDVDGRPLSVVLMMLRERLGEDVDVVGEETTPTRMDRTMRYTDLGGEQTSARWIVMGSPPGSSAGKTFLFALRKDGGAQRGG